jgi:hypothetical protein
MRWAVFILFWAPLLCIAENYYECTSTDGSVTFQIYRCGKGQKSQTFNFIFPDPRNMESAGLVLQCSPCGPGYSYSWVRPGTVSNQLPTVAGVREYPVQVVSREGGHQSATVRDYRGRPTSKRLEDGCPNGVFNALCRIDMRQRQAELDRIERERVQEEFSHQKKVEYLTACIKAGRNRMSANGECVQ